MPCTCNKKTTTLCPSESIEHKILNEARAFYTWAKEKLLAIVAGITALGSPMQAKNVTARYQTFDVVALTASPGSVTIPAKCVCISFQPVGGEVEKTAILTGPSGQTIELAAAPTGARPTVTYPLPAGVYHEAGEWLATMHVLYVPGTTASWRLLVTYEEP